MTIKEKIIAYLEEHKISTEVIGDVLGKTGLVKDVYPLISDRYIVGEIQYFYTHTNSNWPLHDQIRSVERGKICFVDCLFVDDYHAAFGELVSSFIYQKSGAKAIVVDGKMRDLDGIRERKIPVWCKGIVPIGCFNFQVTENAEIKRQASRGREYYDGAIAVCDNSGVVIIPKEELTESFIEKVGFLEEQEKIWFDCVLNKGWNTFDTVCLKKYKEQDK